MADKEPKLTRIARRINADPEALKQAILAECPLNASGVVTLSIRIPRTE